MARPFLTILVLLTISCSSADAQNNLTCVRIDGEIRSSTGAGTTINDCYDGFLEPGDSDTQTGTVFATGNGTWIHSSTNTLTSYTQSAEADCPTAINNSTPTPECSTEFIMQTIADVGDDCSMVTTEASSSNDNDSIFQVNADPSDPSVNSGELTGYINAQLNPDIQSGTIYWSASMLARIGKFHVEISQYNNDGTIQFYYNDQFVGDYSNQGGPASYMIQVNDVVAVGEQIQLENTDFSLMSAAGITDHAQGTFSGTLASFFEIKGISGNGQSTKGIKLFDSQGNLLDEWNIN